MHAVNRFEFNLLRILQAVVGTTPAEHVRPLLRQSLDRPSGLSPTAVDLIQTTIAKGVTLQAARQGAWRRQRFLREGDVVEGSLWERTTPDQLGLRFSAASLDLLIWMTARDGSEAMPMWEPNPAVVTAPFTLGDRLLQYLVAERLTDVAGLAQWYAHPPLFENALIVISRPQRFAAAGASPVADFSTWMSGPAAWVLESLQDALSHSYVDSVRAKATIVDPSEAIAVGEMESRTLEGFIGAAEQAGRPDLCRFVFQAAQRIQPRSGEKSEPLLRQWMPALDVSQLRLAQRASAYASAGALPRAVCRLADWHRRSRSIGFFDEGYAGSQLLKSIWEGYDGETLHQSAEQMLQAGVPNAV